MDYERASRIDGQLDSRAGLARLGIDRVNQDLSRKLSGSQGQVGHQNHRISGLPARDPFSEVRAGRKGPEVHLAIAVSLCASAEEIAPPQELFSLEEGEIARGLD